MKEVKKKSISWPFIGNRHIASYLEKSVNKGNIGGAYIFSGPDNLGKTTMAVYFAQSILCQDHNTSVLPCGQCPSCLSFRQSEAISHGDVHIIKKEKDKKNISVEQARDLIKFLSLSSFLNSYKIGIIKHAGSLSIEAANALLKTLEEPKKNVVIILVAANADELPQTIVSRSKVLNFFPVQTDEIYDFMLEGCKATRSEAQGFAHLAMGRPAIALKFFENKDFYQKYLERVNIFLRFFDQCLGERLSAIGTIMDAKLLGQEAVRSAKRTLEIWQGLVRDFILMENNYGNIIQHKIVETDLKNVRVKMTQAQAVNILEFIKDCEKKLAANVNPRLVLESVAINL